MGGKHSWEHLGKQNAFLFSGPQSERSTISFSQTILWHLHCLQNKETKQRRHVKSWKSTNGVSECVLEAANKSSDTISIKNFLISQKKSEKVRRKIEKTRSSSRVVNLPLVPMPQPAATSALTFHAKAFVTTVLLSQQHWKF